MREASPDFVSLMMGVAERSEEGDEIHVSVAATDGENGCVACADESGEDENIPVSVASNTDRDILADSEYVGREDNDGAPECAAVSVNDELCDGDKDSIDVRVAIEGDA